MQIVFWGTSWPPQRHLQYPVCFAAAQNIALPRGEVPDRVEGPCNGGEYLFVIIEIDNGQNDPLQSPVRYGGSKHCPPCRRSARKGRGPVPEVKRRVNGGECHYRYVKKTLFSLLPALQSDPASPQGSPGYGTHFDLRKPRMDTVFQARRLAL